MLVIQLDKPDNELLKGRISLSDLSSSCIFALSNATIGENSHQTIKTFKQ